MQAGEVLAHDWQCTTDVKLQVYKIASPHAKRASMQTPQKSKRPVFYVGPKPELLARRRILLEMPRRRPMQATAVHRPSSADHIMVAYRRCHKCAHLKRKADFLLPCRSDGHRDYLIKDSFELDADEGARF